MAEHTANKTLHFDGAMEHLSKAKDDIALLQHELRNQNEDLEHLRNQMRRVMNHLYLPGP